MNVFELQTGNGEEYDPTASLGMFATREMAEARIVRLALDGRGLRNAEIVEHEAEGTPTVADASTALGAAPGVTVPADTFERARAVWTGEFAQGNAPLPWRSVGRLLLDDDGETVFDGHGSVSANGTSTEEDVALTELIVELVNGWARNADLVKP